MSGQFRLRRGAGEELDVFLTWRFDDAESLLISTSIAASVGEPTSPGARGSPNIASRADGARSILELATAKGRYRH
jgi:hypothetical protein